MAITSYPGPSVAGIVSCVPRQVFHNIDDATQFSKNEVRKVVAMAGVRERRIAGDQICSSDLCTAAAEKLLEIIGWEKESIDCLIMVTQTPDYFLPSTACVVHKRLELSDRCASFDVGLGCSGYPYGLWLATTMLSGNGINRVLLLHGETPSRFTDKSDRSVVLLFGDAGSATALERNKGQDTKEWFFSLHTDGAGYDKMIIEAGGFRDRFGEDETKHFVRMDGAHVFNFTISRVPDLIHNTVAASGRSMDDIDYFVFHQSNKYIMRLIGKKVGLPEDKVPMILNSYGNTGGVSIPLTMTVSNLVRHSTRDLSLLLLGYGVGLSWASALISLAPDALLDTIELEPI
jgi:3-oxoacyl-[acyl-carrier-protein] synthase-3